MSGEGSHGGPRAPKLGDSYLMFKKEVRLWAATTNIEAKRQAGTIIFTLPDRAKEQAIEITLQHLQNGKKVTVDGVEKDLTGIDCLLEVLDGVYLEDVSKEKFKCYDKFRTLRREENQDVRDFILEFDKSLKQLREHGIDLPEPVIAYELLRGCNIEKNKYSIAVAIVGELTYENMKQTVRNITEISENQAQEPKSNTHSLKVVKEEESTYFTGTGPERYYNPGQELYEPEGVYYGSSGSRRGRSTQFRGYSGQGANRSCDTEIRKFDKRMNPRDDYGKYMACHVCQSIYHFSQQCPERRSGVSENQSFFVKEEISLLQIGAMSLEEFTRDHFGLAIVDSGCNATVCGKHWLDVHLEALSEADKRNVFWSDDKVVNFKFGDNDPTMSSVCCVFPATICGKKVTIRTRVVDDQIPLLFGRQSMKKANMVLDFRNDTATAFGMKQKLVLRKSGHPSIPLYANLQHSDTVKDIVICEKNTAAMNTSRGKQTMQLDKYEMMKKDQGSNTSELQRFDSVYYKRKGSKRWQGPASVVGSEGMFIVMDNGCHILRCYRDHVVRVSDWKNYPDKSGNDLPLIDDETFRDKKLSRKDNLNVNEPSEEEMSTKESVDPRRCLPVETKDHVNSNSKAEIEKLEEWKRSNRYIQGIPTDNKKKKAALSSNIVATDRVRASNKNTGLRNNSFSVGELEIRI